MWSKIFLLVVHGDKWYKTADLLILKKEATLERWQNSHNEKFCGNINLFESLEVCKSNSILAMLPFYPFFYSFSHIASFIVDKIVTTWHRFTCSLLCISEKMEFSSGSSKKYLRKGSWSLPEIKYFDLQMVEMRL